MNAKKVTGIILLIGVGAATIAACRKIKIDPQTNVDDPTADPNVAVNNSNPDINNNQGEDIVNFTQKEVPPYVPPSPIVPVTQTSVVPNAAVTNSATPAIISLPAYSSGGGIMASTAPTLNNNNNAALAGLTFLN